MNESYFINPKKGIYFTRSAYHDSVDYIYEVDFDKPDVNKQFQDFIRMIKEQGHKEGMRELKQQFRSLQDLLTWLYNIYRLRIRQKENKYEEGRTAQSLH